MKNVSGRYDMNPCKRRFINPSVSYGSLRQACLPQAHKPGYDREDKVSADCLQLMADAQEPAPKALENDAIIQSKTVAKGSGVYGCFYHKGAQTLSVRLPGEMVPVKFDCNACTRQINHEQGASEVIVAEAGDYEIIFDLNLTAKAAVFAVLELQVNGTALPGGRYCYMLAVGTQAYRGFTIASLGANDAVRLVMTSGTACEAALACGGVSAALKIIKLGE